MQSFPPQNPPLSLLTFVLALLLATLLPFAGRADTLPALEETEGLIEEITIIGTRQALREVPGSAHIINAEDIARFYHSDIHQLLRRIPGINIREEEGYGLRPNIGIRGSATERSGDITLMEDGILIAPAPYAAPAAYYFPTAGRLAGIEVLKGPAAIAHGPYTVGGALNLLSTPIPEQDSGLLHGGFGTDGAWRGHAWYGTGGERFSALLETHLQSADGFQDLDKVGADTGFDKEDYLAKLQYQLDTARAAHVLLLKLQYSEEDSQQSYLGLTNADFRKDPDRRYAPSQNDLFEGEHRQASLHWKAALDSGLEWSMAVYRNEFERRWFKTEGYYALGDTVNRDPATLSRNSWSSIIDTLNRRDADDMLLGEYQAALDGEDTTANRYIGLRGNNREYFSEGITARTQWLLESGRAEHHLQMGARLHRDEEDRLQPEHFYSMRGGRLEEDVDLLRTNANRIQSASATALWIQDEIRTGDWILTPGLRYEKIRQRRENWGAVATRDMIPSKRSNNIEVLLPGLGIHHSLDSGLALFVGVHKGFTPPGNQPGSEEESSVNYEAGIRLNMADGALLNITAFYNDYKNLLGTCTASTGADCDPGDTFNGGKAEIIGLEIDGGLPIAAGLRANFSFSYTDTEFASNFDSDDFFGEVKKGDPLPYIPETQGQLDFDWQGYLRKLPVNMQLALHYVESACVMANCEQKTDSLFQVDFKAGVRLPPTEQLEFYLQVDNLFDKQHITVRRPYGARANPPRSMFLGAVMHF